MDRTKKIIGLLFGYLHLALWLAYVVVLLFFRGLPVYLFLRIRPFPYADKAAAEWAWYDAAAPADFEPLSGNGMTVMAPSGMFRKDPESDFMIYLNGREKTPEYCMVWFEGPRETGVHESMNEGITGFAMRSYCQHRGIEPIRSDFDYIRACVTQTPEDLNIHSFSDSLFYAYLAFGKSLLMPSVEGMYTCEFDGREGLINVLSWDDPERGTMVLCELYEGENDETEYMFVANAMDTETLCAVLASLRFETPAQE